MLVDWTAVAVSTGVFCLNNWVCCMHYSARGVTQKVTVSALNVMGWPVCEQTLHFGITQQGKALKHLQVQPAYTKP